MLFSQRATAAVRTLCACERLFFSMRIASFTIIIPRASCCYYVEVCWCRNVKNITKTSLITRLFSLCLTVKTNQIRKITPKRYFSSFFFFFELLNNCRLTIFHRFYTLRHKTKSRCNDTNTFSKRFMRVSETFAVVNLVYFYNDGSWCTITLFVISCRFHLKYIRKPARDYCKNRI